MAICRNRIMLWLTFAVFYSVLNMFISVLAHIGEPCRILGFCTGTNVYCDGGICICHPSYPVVADVHLCAKPKKYGEKCKYDAECSYLDNATYCKRQSICDCKENYTYNSFYKKCISTEQNKDSGSIVLPAAVGAVLAVSSIICCLLAIWHVFRKRSAESTREWNWDVVPRRSEPVASSPPLTPPGVHTPMVSSDDALPPYDVAVQFQSPHEDQPPPPYEEVTKNMPRPQMIELQTRSTDEK